MEFPANEPPIESVQETALAARLKTFGKFNGILVLIAAVYTLFPLDIIPDALPLIGYLDDALIDLAALINLFRACRNYFFKKG